MAFPTTPGKAGIFHVAVQLGGFASGGGLAGPSGLAFGPDGNLHAVSQQSGEILRYSGVNGAFLDVFATIPGAANRVPVDLAFGSDANLYVSVQLPESVVLRFSGVDGALIDVFASGSGLFYPAGLGFGPSGSLYVNSLGTDSVLEYDGTSGVFVKTLSSGVGLSETPGDNGGLVFSPTDELLISNAFADSVSAFDADTGAFTRFLVSSAGGGLDNPTWLAIRPVPEPTTGVLFGAGLLALVVIARKDRPDRPRATPDAAQCRRAVARRRPAA